MLDLKKQISIISFTHEEDMEVRNDVEAVDPEAFWQDVVMDAFELGDIDGGNNPLLDDIENLTRIQSKSLSKKFSAIKSENVLFKYEYHPSVEEDQ